MSVRDSDSTVPHPLDLPSSEVLLRRDHDVLMLRAGVRSGQLVRIERGAYLPHQSLADEEAWRRSAATLRARSVADAARLSPRTVLSHVTAAAIHGLWVPPLIVVVHVTQTFKTTSQRDTVIRHHRPLSEDEIVLIDGFRVTALTRTVLDCVTTLPVEWGLAVADSAMRSRLASPRDRPPQPAEIEAVRAEWLEALAAMGATRGCRKAREILARADPRSESPGESRLRCIALAAGLPAPLLQMPVPTSAGLFYADFGWLVDTTRGPRFACVEFDGTGKYADPAEKEREQLRQRAIEVEGHRVARFTGEDLVNDVRHEVLPRLLALVPHLAQSCEPVVHLNPQPARRRNRRA